MIFAILAAINYLLFRKINLKITAIWLIFIIELYCSNNWKYMSYIKVEVIFYRCIPLWPVIIIVSLQIRNLIKLFFYCYIHNNITKSFKLLFSYVCKLVNTFFIIILKYRFILNNCVTMRLIKCKLSKFFLFFCIIANICIQMLLVRI